MDSAQKKNTKRPRFDSVAEVLNWISISNALVLPPRSDGRLLLILKDKREERVTIVTDQTRIWIDPDPEQEPNVVFSLSKSDFLEWNNGSLNPMRLMMENRLHIEGSIILATKFQLLFGPGE